MKRRNSSGTPENRVVVERMGASEHVFVMLDGEVVEQFDGEDKAEEQAESCRQRIIARLKGQASS